MKQRRNMIAGLTVLLAAAILVLISILRVRSEPGSAVLWGLSASRLVIFLAFSVFALGALLALAAVSRFGPKTERALTALAQFILIDPYRSFLVFIISAGWLVLTGAALFGELLPQISNAPEFLAPLYSRLRAVIVFLNLLCLTLLWLIRQVYVWGLQSKLEKRSGRFSFPELVGLMVLVIFLIGLLTLFVRVWVLLLTRGSFASLSPFFFWQNLENDRPFNLVYLLVLTAAAGAGSFWILKSRANPVLKTILWGGVLVYLTIAIQSEIFPQLTLRYEHPNTGSYAYSKFVCAHDSFGDAVQSLAADQSVSWLRTKPPGYLLPYWGMKKIVEIGQSNAALSAVECQSGIWALTRWLTPLISLLALIPLYQVARRVVRPEHAAAPGLLFVLLPNTLLMTGYADQFLFPLLFLLGVWLGVLTTEKNSLGWAAAAGAWLYLSAAISYSLLPAALFVLGWLVFSHVFDRMRNLLPLIRLGLGMLLGGALAAALLYAWMDYNPVQRFSSSLSAHRSMVMTTDSLISQLQNVQINLTEYLVWIGPLIGLAIASGLVWSVLRRTQAFSKQKKVFLIAAGLLILALLLSGQNRGEVGRLWLFLNPLAAISAVVVLEVFPQKVFRRLMVVIALVQIWSAYFYIHSLFSVVSV